MIKVVRPWRPGYTVVRSSRADKVTQTCWLLAPRLLSSFSLFRVLFQFCLGEGSGLGGGPGAVRWRMGAELRESLP